MVRILSTALGIIAIAVFFYSKVAALVIYIIPVAYLLVNQWALRQTRVNPSPDLSEGAKNLILRYPHWYTYPNVAKDNGAAARTLSFFGAVLACLSYVDHFYWGAIVILVVAIPAMLFVSRKVDPIRYLKNEAEKKTHEEIMEFILKK
jgi:hypothetical protein